MERIDHIRGLERALEAYIEAIKASDADSAEMILRSDFEELDYLRFLIAQLDETFVATHVKQRSEPVIPKDLTLLKRALDAFEREAREGWKDYAKWLPRISQAEAWEWLWNMRESHGFAHSRFDPDA
jgi:hypothetical protein